MIWLTLKHYKDTTTTTITANNFLIVASEQRNIGLVEIKQGDLHLEGGW